MSVYIYPVLFGITCGLIARLIMLRTDYRQYPTYLHGKIIHISLGFIDAIIDRFTHRNVKWAKTVRFNKEEAESKKSKSN